MVETVNVILTTEDAEQFKRFQKYHEVFVAMEQKGALDIQFGKCTLNFAGGLLQNIIKGRS